MNFAGSRQRIAADAAGQGDAAAIAVHDAAITAGKGKQWHHAIRQRAAAEMGLEGEQVGGPRLRGDGEGTPGVPGTAGRDHYPRADLIGSVGAPKREYVPVRPPAQRGNFGGLKQHRSRRDGGIAQQHIQMFAAQRPAPSRLCMGQRRLHHRVAGIGRDLVHRRARPAARKSPATPQASSTGMVAAEMNSPHTLRRGNTARSTSATDQPTCASSRAAVAPAGPLPITAASNRIALCREEMGEGKRQSFLQIRQPAPGHRRDSSRPAKPARTLATASCRVTSLQPSANTMRLASRADRERRGSQATKPRAFSAASVSRRARATSSR